MFNKSESMPQFIDRFLTRTALGVLLMSFAYGAGAATYLVDDPLHDWLETAQLLLSLGAVAAVLPVFVKLFRLRHGVARVDCGPEGFIAGAFRKAGSHAFTFAFIVLILFEPLSKRWLTDLPTAFFINVLLCLILGVFSGGFFLLSRDDAPEDEFDAGDDDGK
ncbi:MAG: hypothetical protein R3200_12440 [Xanthomonadales bacterium]|nr:hypothetical protein [Xanthomonadales bacterium]